MKKSVIALFGIVCAAPVAQATVLQFDGLGTNVSLQDSTKGALVANYGDHVAGPGTGIAQGNGYTPNIGVAFQPDGGNTGGGSGSGGDGWQAYNDSEWSVAQLDGIPANNNFDVVFTPDAGFGVQINSFVFDDYGGYAAGHTFDWQILVGGSPITGGSGVVVNADQNLLVNTGLTSAIDGPVTLRITPTAGAIDDRGIDSVNFDQAVAVPEPAALSCLVLMGAINLMRRRS